MPHPNFNPSFFLTIFTVAGIFVFAISGALAGIKRQADIFGVLVLAIVAALSGGIIRDVLIGAVPPDNLQHWEYLLAALLAAVVSVYFFPLVNKLANPVELFDAIGLGVFTVLGTQKALLYHITPLWAVAMGILTGVGGGICRDMLLAQVPIILRAEVYATAAMVGAIIVVAGHSFFPELPGRYAMVLGAVVCTTLRLLALHYRWHIHIIPPSAGA